MKHLFITCVFLLCSVASSVGAENIKLIKSELGPDLRSVVIDPTASIDGNFISIYSVTTIQSAQVVVKDMAGNVIYTDTTAIPAGQYYSFTLDNVESGDYVLELTYGKKYLYGYFAL